MKLCSSDALRGSCPSSYPGCSAHSDCANDEHLWLAKGLKEWSENSWLLNAFNMGELHDPPLSFMFPAVNLWHMIWDRCSHLPTLTCEKIWVCKGFWRRGMWSVCTAPVSERLIIGGWCCINIWEFRLPWWLDTIPDLSGSFSLWLIGPPTKLRLRPLQGQPFVKPGWY